MKTGIIHGEKNEDYHASGAVGHTMMCDYLCDPEAYYNRHVLRRPDWQRQPSSAMSLGSMVHACNEHRYVQVIDEEDLTSTGLIRKAAQKKYGEASVTPHAKWLWQGILDNECASAIISTAVGKEVVMRAQDPSGLYVQAKADGYHADFIYDIKTTRSLKAFNYACRDYGYDVEAGLYCELHKQLNGRENWPDFFFIVVETDYPFRCKVLKAPYEMILAGWEKAAMAIEGIAKCNWGEPQTEPEEMEWK